MIINQGENSPTNLQEQNLSNSKNCKDFQLKSIDSQANSNDSYQQRRRKAQTIETMDKNLLLQLNQEELLQQSIQQLRMEENQMSSVDEKINSSHNYSGLLQRSKKLLQSLEEATKYLPFFEKMRKKNGGELLHQKCLQIMKYQHIKKGDSIYRVNDKPEYFYVLLKGEACILQMKKQKDIEQEWNLKKQDEQFMKKLKEEEELKRRFTRLGISPKKETNIKSQVPPQKIDFYSSPPRKNPKKSLSSHALIQGQENISEGILKFINDKRHFFYQGHIFKYELLHKIYAGYSFGEQGLIRKHPRFNTLLCSKNCHLLIMDKEQFQKELKWKETQKTDILNNLLANSILKNQSIDFITKCSQWYQIVKYPTRHVIYREGEDPEACYIIKKGEVKIQEHFDLGQIFKTNPILAQLDSKGRLNIEYRQEIMKMLIDQIENLNKNLSDENKLNILEQKKKWLDFIKNITLIKMKQGQWFGDYEIIKNYERQQTVICETNVTLLMFPKKKFLDILRLEMNLEPYLLKSYRELDHYYMQAVLHYCKTYITKQIQSLKDNAEQINALKSESQKNLEKASVRMCETQLQNQCILTEEVNEIKQKIQNMYESPQKIDSSHCIRMKKPFYACENAKQMFENKQSNFDTYQIINFIQKKTKDQCMIDKIQRTEICYPDKLSASNFSQIQNPFYKLPEDKVSQLKYHNYVNKVRISLNILKRNKRRLIEPKKYTMVEVPNHLKNNNDEVLKSLKSFTTKQIFSIFSTRQNMRRAQTTQAIQRAASKRYLDEYPNLNFTNNNWKNSSQSSNRLYQFNNKGKYESIQMHQSQEVLFEQPLSKISTALQNMNKTDQWNSMVPNSQSNSIQSENVKLYQSLQNFKTIKKSQLHIQKILDLQKDKVQLHLNFDKICSSQQASQQNQNNFQLNQQNKNSFLYNYYNNLNKYRKNILVQCKRSQTAQALQNKNQIIQKTGSNKLNKDVLLQIAIQNQNLPKSIIKSAQKKNEYSKSSYELKQSASSKINQSPDLNESIQSSDSENVIKKQLEEYNRLSKIQVSGPLLLNVEKKLNKKEQFDQQQIPFTGEQYIKYEFNQHVDDVQLTNYFQQQNPQNIQGLDIPKLHQLKKSSLYPIQSNLIKSVLHDKLIQLQKNLPKMYKKTPHSMFRLKKQKLFQ